MPILKYKFDFSSKLSSSKYGKKLQFLLYRHHHIHHHQFIEE